MIALFVLVLLECARAQQFSPLHFSDSKKMTAEQFHKIPDNPYNDPADDIPQVPQQPAAIQHDEFLPRDRYLQSSRKPQITKDSSEQRAHLWIDYQRLHDELIQEQARPDGTTRKPHRYIGYSTPSAPRFNQKVYQEKVNAFEPSKFVLKSDDMVRKINNMTYSIVWTTCDEFKYLSKYYDPAEIVNFDWIPFYTWSPEAGGSRAVVHRFQVPTKRQVYQYHTKFSPYLNRTVDWNNPKLYLDRDLGEYTAILIAVDDSGLYYCIWNFDLPQFVQQNKITLMTLTIRLRIIGDYLALMHCGENRAMIMARDGHVPKTNKAKREAAKMLKFKGKGRAVTRDKEAEKEIQQIKIEQERFIERSVMSAVGPGFDDRPIGSKRKNIKESVVPVYQQLMPGGPLL